MFRKILLLMCLGLICTQSMAFELIGEKPPTIYVENTEEQVVFTALDLFCADLELVSGKKAHVSTTHKNPTIIIGTLGKSSLITQLTTAGQLSVNELKGAWEAFQIQVLNKDGNRMLVVVGSDKRGTAYGIMELSRLIGVSPWVWWADSTPDKKTKLNIPDTYFTSQQPSVQYRGFFINDEGGGFMPWSTLTYENTPNKGATGPKTYERVFELLLRLRANVLWPAMHPCTVPFYFMNGNKEMADKYGIVMGTSHCEPLMCCASEWDKSKYGDYNYVTNKKTITDYWTSRLKEVGKYENFYTIGLRGIHDVEMEGASTLDEQTTLLTQAITDQRELLKQQVNKEVTQLPQLFVPYKEVLPIYENGLNVPDDVTLMWCDDNYGYLTRLSNEEEQKRSGGAGIYYHVSYWGRPHPYILLSATSPSLVYWQMKKAWDAQARKIWILNVGDIKPAEYDIEFFMDMAWNIDRFNPTNMYEAQEQWLAREFGAEPARQINPLRNEYYRLAHIRKPEFMGWSRIEVGPTRARTPVEDSEFNPYAFGDEIYQRLEAYQQLVDRTIEAGRQLPPYKQDAYNQLVQFPICASAEMNKKLLYAQKARLYARYNLPVANEYAQKSLAAFQAADSLMNDYNQVMSNGKWNHMMQKPGWPVPVYEKPDLPQQVQASNSKQVMLWMENAPEPVKQEGSMKLTPFVVPTGTATYLSVFSRDGKAIAWSVRQKPDWITIEEEPTGLTGEKRINFSICMDKWKHRSEQATCTLLLNGQKYTFALEASQASGTIPTEYNKMVVIDTSKPVNGYGKHTPIQGLGYSCAALSMQTGKEQALRYKIQTSSTGKAIVRTYLLPNHPLQGSNIRYAISIDNGPYQVVSFKSGLEHRDEDWKANVLRNQSVTLTQHNITHPGEHTISIYAVDEGVILDQLMLDFQPDRKFYEIH